MNLLNDIGECSRIFSWKLQTARTSAGFSKEEAAERIGVDVETWDEWEDADNSKEPPIDWLPYISDALSVPLYEFFQPHKVLFEDRITTGGDTVMTELPFLTGEAQKVIASYMHTYLTEHPNETANPIYREHLRGD